MKKAGLWVVGSLFEEFVSDDTVFIDEIRHKGFVGDRPDLDWKSVLEVKACLKQIINGSKEPIRCTPPSMTSARPPRPWHRSPKRCCEAAQCMASVC